MIPNHTIICVAEVFNRYLLRCYLSILRRVFYKIHGIFPLSCPYDTHQKTLYESSPRLIILESYPLLCRYALEMDNFYEN